MGSELVAKNTTAGSAKMPKQAKRMKLRFGTVVTSKPNLIKKYFNVQTKQCNNFSTNHEKTSCKLGSICLILQPLVIYLSVNIITPSCLGRHFVQLQYVGLYSTTFILTNLIQYICVFLTIL